MTPDLIKGSANRDVRYTTLVYKRQTIFGACSRNAETSKQD